jgi:hypothetical protein
MRDQHQNRSDKNRAQFALAGFKRLEKYSMAAFGEQGLKQWFSAFLAPQIPLKVIIHFD